ncbi:MAG: DUF6600 domain-containing protein [Acidobacteriota bacterium]
MAAAASFLLIAAPALAQEAAPTAEGSQYAHVRYVSGSLNLVRAYDGESVPLELNLPIIAGDRLQADSEAWLELGLADASFLWARGPLLLDVHSLAALDSTLDALTHLTLHRGDLALEVIGMDQHPDKAVQVDTPSGTIYVMTGGLYRISVDESGEALVSVVAGVVEVSSDGGTALVRSGQRTGLARGQAPLRPRAARAEPDDFDLWVEQRRQALAQIFPEAEHLPQPVQAYAGELSAYGRWERLPSYGLVWIPKQVEPGWAPYYDGYWVGSPAGHLWVSYEPWGWIPYHYGRWQWVVGTGWCWVPGPVFAGGWVHWWVGPSYVSWVPLGYYNRPAINLHVSLSSHRRAPRRGWACVPYSAFFERNLPRRYARDPGLVRAHLERSVPTRRLPSFHPRDLRSRPNLGSEMVRRARQSDQQLPRRRFHRAVSSASPAQNLRGLGVRLRRTQAEPFTRRTLIFRQTRQRAADNSVRTRTTIQQVGPRARRVSPPASTRGNAGRQESSSASRQRGGGTIGAQRPALTAPQRSRSNPVTARPASAGGVRELFRRVTRPGNRAPSVRKSVIQPRRRVISPRRPGASTPGMRARQHPPRTPSKARSRISRPAQQRNSSSSVQKQSRGSTRQRSVQKPSGSGRDRRSGQKMSPKRSNSPKPRQSPSPRGNKKPRSRSQNRR